MRESNVVLGVSNEVIAATTTGIAGVDEECESIVNAIVGGEAPWLGPRSSRDIDDVLAGIESAALPNYDW